MNHYVGDPRKGAVPVERSIQKRFVSKRRPLLNPAQKQVPRGPFRDPPRVLDFQPSVRQSQGDRVPVARSQGLRDFGDLKEPVYAPAGGRPVPQTRASSGSRASSGRLSDRSNGPNERQFIVQGALYSVRKCIGKGGTSEVYEVTDVGGNTYALKKVTVDSRNAVAFNLLRGEIELLQHLSSETRVVQLIAHEVDAAALMLVMELGEMDLRLLLGSNRQGLDTAFVRYWATEVFKCVQAVHGHDIVHSDLKPENFLVVKGRLKIIDFGIANVVPDYTVNVHRDVKMGTVSYMAPEAVCEQTSFQGKDFKVGKPADIWSCGCIVYEMVYGCTPLRQYGRQQLAVLESQSLQITFSKTVKEKRIAKGLLELMSGCLAREPEKRLTVAEALQGLFLHPRSVDYDFVHDLIMKSITLGQNSHRPATKERLDPLVHEVWAKIVELNDAEPEHEPSVLELPEHKLSSPRVTPTSPRDFL